jgi:signal transduction histidine kinase
MPSRLFQQLATSQLELLATSLGETKIQSIILYLPQEHGTTGALEFLPAVLFPASERVFIAHASGSLALPKTLSKLPGFAQARSVLPTYPILALPNHEQAGIGAVEEFQCGRAAALSVPLVSGPQTVGALLVLPVDKSECNTAWTNLDRQQVARAAQSLSLALSMDAERALLETQNKAAQDALRDSLHQLKNPVQALRTYGKLLQQRVAGRGTTPPQLAELIHHLLAQSDRLVDRLAPVDAIIDSLSASNSKPTYFLNPAPVRSLVPWQPPSQSDTSVFAQATNNVTGKNNSQTISETQGPTPDTSNVEVETVSTDSSDVQHSTSLSFMEDMELEMNFVEDILSENISAFKAIASDRKIVFVVECLDELPGVHVCAEALQEAFTNVLDNAFRYVVLPKFRSDSLDRNANPQIRLRLFANKKSDAGRPGVTLRIEDNGPGIPSNDRTLIFKRGFRCPTTDAVEGSGIGLDIALALVERMGGTLRVMDNDATTLDGAVFEMVLFR